MTIDDTTKSIGDSLSQAADGFKKMQIVLMVCTLITAVAVVLLTVNILNKK